MNKPFKYFFVSIIISLLIINFLFIEFSEKIISSENNLNSEKFFPSDYQLIKRTFPHYDYDKNAYQDAVEQLKIMKTAQKKSLMKKKNNWQFVGPINIGGRIVDIEFDPANPNIVYAAAATGGVFKSTDTGENWFPIFDDEPILSIGDIGIDPNNTQVVYVGTGEANGGHNNFPGFGVYKTSNGGESWNLIGLDSTVSISRIIVDPSNSERIFVAAVGSYFTPNSQRGVYLSEDAGETWTKSLFVSDSTGAIDLVINPSNPNVLYAAMWERVRRPVLRSGTHLSGPSGGIYKTTDGGINWIKLDETNGLPNPNFDTIGRIGLTISKSNPQILYATYNDGSSLFGIFKSIDAGESWQKTNDDFSGSSSFSWYFGQIRVHPQNSETVFVLDVPLLKSTNSGSTWDFSYGYSGPGQLHVDHHALAFHPKNADYILSGNDGGINISENGGRTWSQPVSLPITQFYEIGLDFSHPDRFYGGTQDNNTIRTLNGNNNNWERIYGGDGFYVLVDPNNSDIIYAESQFGDLGKSIDGGEYFSNALNGINSGEPTNWSTPVVLDPNNSNILYYGTHTLYRTENGTGSWRVISPKLTDHNLNARIGTITTIAVAPTNSDVIYVGTDDGHVWVSSDYGNTWKDISATLPFRWVTRVVVDPKNENIIYATFSGLRWADPESKVFKSENMGDTWESISNGLPEAPVNAFAVDNNNSNILYLGNDIGVFISYDKGNNWEIFGEDLPIVVVNDMKIHPTKNYLAIGTHGRGIYTMDLTGLVGTKKEEVGLPSNFELQQNYPNPFNPITTIKYSIPLVKTQRAVLLQLIIYDILGSKVTTLVNKEQSPGFYEIQFDASNLSSGVYYYTLTTGDFFQTKKMIFLK